MENPSIEEVRAELLELVREGRVFASQRPCAQGCGRKHAVTFVADIYATDEDREFTKGWLEEPYFELNS